MFFLQKVLAATGELCSDGTIKDPSVGCIETPAGIVDSNTNLSDLILKSANLILMFAGSIAVIMLIVSGLQYATAMGDEEKMNQAKMNFKWSGIGLIVSLSAYGIVEFVIKNII